MLLTILLLPALLFFTLISAYAVRTAPWSREELSEHMA